MFEGTPTNYDQPQMKADYDRPRFDASGRHTYWFMPHALGVEMAVVGPYHGKDDMLAAARCIVSEQMDHEDDNVYALAIDSNGEPATRCLGHLVDERDGRDG